MRVNIEAIYFLKCKQIKIEYSVRRDYVITYIFNLPDVTDVNVKNRLLCNYFNTFWVGYLKQTD
jgi:hypothetical protein